MIRKILVGLLLSVGGLAAYLHANPLSTRHPAPGPTLAQDLFAVSEAEGADLLFKEHDNTSGLLVRAFMHRGDYVVIVSPRSPHPDHQNHMREPVDPASGVLRYAAILEEEEFPLSPVGSSWVAVVPGSAVRLVPGDRLSLLIWEAGADPREDDDAAFWGFLELH